MNLLTVGILNAFSLCTALKTVQSVTEADGILKESTAVKVCFKMHPSKTSQHDVDCGSCTWLLIALHSLHLPSCFHEIKARAQVQVQGTSGCFHFRGLTLNLWYFKQEQKKTRNPSLLCVKHPSRAPCCSWAPQWAPEKIKRMKKIETPWLWFTFTLEMGKKSSMRHTRARLLKVAEN